MKKIIFIFVGLLFAVTCDASSLKKSCDNNAYKIADAKLESAIKSLKNAKEPWKELQSVFKIWEPCKDRFQDEGFIDAIAELTSTRWDRISDLIEVKTKYPTFYKYIIQSLGNETVGIVRWNKIVALSKKECPKGAKEICKDIESADKGSN